MLLLEEHMTLLLVAHTFLALATVALTTHLVFWLRNYLRGRYGKRRSIVRFALLSTGAYGLTMLGGMLLYPTYKVRVRAEYLENPSAIHRATEVASEARALTRVRNEEVRRYRSGQPPQITPPPEVDSEAVATLADARALRGVKLSRWFDVKEHWALLGLLLSMATCGILLAWDPKKDEGSQGITRMVIGLALGAAAISWAAAIIGIVTAAARSVTAL